MSGFSPELRAEFPGEIAQMDEVEEYVREWEARFQHYEALTQEALREAYDLGQNTARMLINLQATAIAGRCAALTKGFITLVNAHNMHSTPPIARSLVETGCVAFYLRQNVIPRLKKGRNKDVKRRLWRLGLGTATDVGHVRPISVKSLLRAGKEWIRTYMPAGADERPLTILQTIYTPLTDQTHPNWGAISIGTEINPKDGTVSQILHPRIDPEALNNWLSATSFLLCCSGMAMDSVVKDAAKHPMIFADEDPDWNLGNEPEA